MYCACVQTEMQAVFCGFRIKLGSPKLKFQGFEVSASPASTNEGRTVIGERYCPSRDHVPTTSGLLHPAAGSQIPLTPMESPRYRSENPRIAAEITIVNMKSKGRISRKRFTNSGRPRGYTVKRDQPPFSSKQNLGEPVQNLPPGNMKSAFQQARPATSNWWAVRKLRFSWRAGTFCMFPILRPTAGRPKFSARRERFRIDGM